MTFDKFWQLCVLTPICTYRYPDKLSAHLSAANRRNGAVLQPKNSKAAREFWNAIYISHIYTLAAPKGIDLPLQSRDIFLFYLHSSHSRRKHPAVTRGAAGKTLKKGQKQSAGGATKTNSYRTDFFNRPSLPRFFSQSSPDERHARSFRKQ